MTTPDERTIEPMEESDDFLTQVRKFRESGLDLYIALQMMVDLDTLKNELAAHHFTGQIIEGAEMQQIYKLPLVVLAWFERITDEEDPEGGDSDESSDVR